MKADYTTPKAEKLEFDYTSTVVASNGGKTKQYCAIKGATVYYEDGAGNQYSTSAGGDE